jgi:capsular polysaccharide biosynthesis protein
MLGPKTFPTTIEFDWIENRGKEFEGNEVFLISKSVTFLKGNGVIFGRKLFEQTTYGKLNQNIELKKYLKDIFKSNIIIRNNILILTDIWSTGPYHWYVDLLSKLFELRSQSNINFKSASIVLFDDAFTTEVAVPILNDLGFGELKIINVKKDSQYVLLGRNYFVTKPHRMGTNNPSVIRGLRDLIFEKLNLLESNEKFKSITGIYYYRHNRNRRVLEDSEIIPELEKRGFYCTTFDDISYLEAFKLMQKTKIFVGIHGGGLTNMMFLTAGSYVVEIKNNNPNPNSHCYWHLARSLQLDYTMYVAETVGDQNVIEGRGCDVRIKPLEFINFIDELSERKD